MTDKMTNYEKLLEDLEVHKEELTVQNEELNSKEKIFKMLMKIIFIYFMSHQLLI